MDATFVQGGSLKKNFGQTLELMADVALHPSFPADEIERQRASRLAQLVQQRENAGQVAANVTAPVLYGERHPYGFTEIGTEPRSKRCRAPIWRRSGSRTSCPTTRRSSWPATSPWPSSSRSPKRRSAGGRPGPRPGPCLATRTPRPHAWSSSTSRARRKPSLRVVGIGAPRSSPDFQAIQVMNMALGGLFSSRINMNLREEHGYTYGASSQFAFRRSAGPFVTGAGVRTDVTAPAVTEILKEVRGMADKPMSADELPAVEGCSRAFAARRLRDELQRRRQLLERLHLRPRARLLHEVPGACRIGDDRAGAGGGEEVSGAGEADRRRRRRSREDRAGAEEAQPRDHGSADARGQEGGHTLSDDDIIAEAADTQEKTALTFGLFGLCR